MESRQLVVITFASIAILLTLSSVYSNFDVIQAFAGDSLSSDNVAKTVLVRVTDIKTLNEDTYDSFSRVGFVSGEGNFLLESIPSKDKKSFYQLLKKSIESRNQQTKEGRMHVSIDLYSGDGEIIQSLEYRDCGVTEYFVYGVDSKGKVLFTENDGGVEIREVTKFECIGFTLNFDPFSETQEITKTLEEIEEERSENERLEKERLEELKKLEAKKAEEQQKLDESSFEHGGEDPYFSNTPKNPVDGDLFYNSMTNTLQRFQDGSWINVSGVGGPATPTK